MSLDKELEQAVIEAVEEEGQSASVAKRILHWLSEMSNGQVSRADIDEFLKLSLDSINVDCLED